MKSFSLTQRQQRTVLFVILMCLFVFYLTQLTRFGIWYDEGIEYLYSKFMSGPLPDNVVANAEGTNNMYERVVITYQPPLYNLVMHVWLSLFDSEWSFRLIGVIVTFIGAIGFFKALKTVSSDYYCALIGTVVYLFIPCVMFYGLECAEYNLMLCLVVWGLYYFLECMHENGCKKDKKNLFLFLIFACLAAYTQYGSILIMGILYIVLLAVYIKRKDKGMIRFAAIGGGMAIVLCGVPLMIFFLLPQMELQASSSVSHTPVFVNNLVYSLFYGVKVLTEFIFHTVSSRMMGFVIAVFGIMSVVALFYKNRNLSKLWLLSCAIYLLYFILVMLSFYAYNKWDGSLGCNNLGNRYTLYMVPVVFMTLFYGVYLFYNKFVLHGKYHIVKKIIFFSIVLLYIVALIRTPGVRQKDAGEKEAYEAWFNAGGYNHYTLVENFQNPAFQFYYMHSDKYDPSRNCNVIGEGNWSRRATSEEIYDNFNKMGIFSQDTVIIISSSQFAKNEKLKQHDEAMRKAGYTSEYILDKRNSATDQTSVIRFAKSK